MAPGRTGAGAAVRARLMLALALASVLSGPPAAACPTKCTCSAASVDCHGLGLRAVPRGIPRNAERLDLDRNNITRITKTDFAGLKNLRVLHLEDNQVSVIERGAFQDLKQLERLRLNKNKLQVLPELLFQSNLKLTRLLQPGSFRSECWQGWFPEASLLAVQLMVFFLCFCCCCLVHARP